MVSDRRLLLATVALLNLAAAFGAVLVLAAECALENRPRTKEQPMLPEDQRALAALTQIADSSHVRGMVHIVAVSPKNAPDLFEVEVVGSVHDPLMVWQILCAAKESLAGLYGYTDADAALEAAIAP